MVRVVWSKTALDNFQEHLLYIEKDSFQNVKAVAKKIAQSIDRLERFPLIGRIVPEYNQEMIRELIVYQYRIVYRIKNLDTVEIVSIFHCRQSMK